MATGSVVCSNIPALISPLDVGNTMFFNKALEPGLKAAHPRTCARTISTGLFTALKASHDLAQVQSKVGTHIRRMPKISQLRARLRPMNVFRHVHVSWLLARVVFCNIGRLALFGAAASALDTLI